LPQARRHASDATPVIDFPPVFWYLPRAGLLMRVEIRGAMKKVPKNAGDWFDPAAAIDFLPLDHLRALQLKRLQSVLKRAYDHVSLTRVRMDSKGLRPEDIRTLEDIRHLPFTVKTDLRDTYPFGMFASSMEEVVRLHSSSGTTGKPIVVAYTQQDLDVWSSVMVRSFVACGVNRHDVIQNAYGYGLFTGGLGAHYGAENLGATVIPISGGNTDRQIMVMKDFCVTVICCTPSYFVHLIERARELGEDIRRFPLRVGVFGAEPWSDEMRRHIEAESGIKAHDIYGLSEIIGPGVGIECECQSGLHIFEDHFYPEIVDPATGAPCEEGAEGELVLTTLSKQAIPMLRYRTRDITRIRSGSCECGRTIRRIRRISRRSDDMFIIRGVNVFPSQIEAALLAVEGTVPHYLIVLRRARGLDQMEVRVEVTPQVFSDTVGALEGLQAKLMKAIENVLGISVEVRLVEPHSIERSAGKAKRVLDERNINP
jgi:phenylacetate-CoA ligase